MLLVVSNEQVQLERRKLLYILEDIVRKCDLDALAVVTQQDAEEIAFYSELETNSDVFCTIAAATLDTANKVTEKMTHGVVTELVVIGATGFTIMNPVGKNFILIGAGRDFYSMGKTILILREKAKSIPLSIIDLNNTKSKRKACSHFCKLDDLYCCVCGKKKELCELCLNSVQQKQIEAKKIRDSNGGYSPVFEESINQKKKEFPINETDFTAESDLLIGKVKQKISERSKDNLSEDKPIKAKKEKKKSAKKSKKKSKRKKRKK